MNPDLSVAKPPPRRRRWQWSLATLLLLMAACAAWVAFVQVGRESDKLRWQIDTMRALTRKLVIDDPAKFAVIECEEAWYGDDRWDVHLPPGDYQIKLATSGIDVSGLADVKAEAQISAGRHEVGIVPKKDPTSGAWTVTVSIDGKATLEINESAEWQSAGGSSDHVVLSSSSQSSTSEPLFLKRQRFNIATSPGSSASPQGTASGILLWIQRSPAAPASSAP